MRSINKGENSMERLMVVRVTKSEFELSDGRIYPMMFDYADDSFNSKIWTGRHVDL